MIEKGNRIRFWTKYRKEIQGVVIQVVPSGNYPCLIGLSRTFKCRYKNILPRIHDTYIIKDDNGKEYWTRGKVEKV